MRLWSTRDISNTYQVSVSHHTRMGPSSSRKTSWGLPRIVHYGELCNYFMIYYNVIIIEIECTIKVMHLNYPKTFPLPHPSPWKICLPQNQSLVPKIWGPLVYNMHLGKHGWPIMPVSMHESSSHKIQWRKKYQAVFDITRTKQPNLELNKDAVASHRQNSREFPQWKGFSLFLAGCKNRWRQRDD